MIPQWLSALTLIVISQAVPVETVAPPQMSPVKVKAAFLKLLERPRVALDVVEENAQTEDGLTIERLSFASEKKADGAVERVPVLLVRPETDKTNGASTRRKPVVIVLHGTGGTKDKMKPW